MTADVDAALMASVSALVSERLGLDFPESRWGDLGRGLASMSAELGLQDASAVVRWALASPLTTQRMELLASHLTVGETYLFREPESFRALESEILPERARARGEHGSPIRMWSAACCTGEEAYSLAITAERAFHGLPGPGVSILATDINPRFLAKARAGVYTAWSFRDTPPGVQERYFRAVDRTFAIEGRFRAPVQLAYLNLAEDAYPSLVNQTNAMDVIFCRNVLMYMTPAKQRRVAAGLSRCLVEGGWLVVSPSEASAALFPELTMVHCEGALFFRKQAAASVRSLPPAPSGQRPVGATESEPSSPPATDHGAPRRPTPAPREAVQRPTPPSFELARRLIDEGNLDAAGDVLRVAAPAEPGRTRALLGLARAHADSGRLDEAMAWCDRAIAADGASTAAHYLRATIHQELGHLDEAAAALGTVLYLDQDAVLAHYLLGALDKRQGKERGAARHFGIALELLREKGSDELVPDSDGTTCGRLAASIVAATEA